MATPSSPAGPLLDPDSPKMEDPAPLQAVHTANFPALLRQLGASLLVTTYQAGKLVVVRDEGDHLNTHFRTFQAPMGMALSGDKLALGTKMQVWQYVDVPAVTAKLEPPGRHDACFLPRSSHVTGNIQIHEMAWGAGGALWVVNTRFSCLCTIDGSASFRAEVAAAVRDGAGAHRPLPLERPGDGRGPPALRRRHWARPTHRSVGGRTRPMGGILIDVASGEVITRGLSMPHSPRWYAGRLWVCESGAGTFGFIDANTRKYTPIAEVPGFTRGVDFAGNLAFVGLSQVRESAVFSGIPITERLAEDERTCGVCAIDLTTGQVVALLRFETAVQEVFAVTVLPGRRYPELINDDDTLLENSFVVPDAALADVSAALRAPAEPSRGAGEERECAARDVREGVREVVHHSRLFITRGATEP